MTVNVTKPALNIREKLAELDKPSGIAGEAMLRADSVQEQRNLIGAGRKNLIINGGMQVSQRGDYTTATAASHNNYYLDRWRFESGLSQTVQDTGFKQKVVVTSGGTNIVGVRQHIEDKTYNRLLGKTVTLSAKVTSNSSDARICSYADGWRVGTAHTGGGSEETLTLTYTVPSSLSVAALILEVAITGSSYSNVAISTGDYLEISEAQLELGSVATDFEHRSYGEELALCQRYCYVFDGTQNQDLMLFGVGSGTGTANCTHLHPVEMRSTPTLTTTAMSTFSSYSFGAQSTGGTPTTFGVSTAMSNKNWFYIDVVCSGNITGTGVMIRANGNATKLTFDAEL